MWNENRFRHCIAYLHDTLHQRPLNNLILIGPDEKRTTLIFRLENGLNCLNALQRRKKPIKCGRGPSTLNMAECRHATVHLQTLGHDIAHVVWADGVVYTVNGSLGDNDDGRGLSKCPVLHAGEMKSLIE